jgi:hypothetical protein
MTCVLLGFLVLFVLLSLASEGMTNRERASRLSKFSDAFVSRNPVYKRVRHLVDPVEYDSINKLCESPGRCNAASIESVLHPI